MTAPAGGIRVDLTVDGSNVAAETKTAVQKQLNPIIAEATKSAQALDASLKKVGAGSGLKNVIHDAQRVTDAQTEVIKSATGMSRAVEKYADSARAAYKKVAEATKEVERQEAALEERRKSGNGTWIRVQSEQVKQAKAAEAKAVREAAAAYGEYERAARGGAGSTHLSDRFKGLTAGAIGAGKEAAEGFAGSFGGKAAELLKVGGRGGGVAAVITAAFVLGKEIVDQVEQGMATKRLSDVFSQRVGLDPASAARFGREAAESYAKGFGESIESNLEASQVAIQGGLLKRDASDADIQDVTEKLNTLKDVMGKDIPETARAAGQLIRGGLAKDATEAFDILIAGFQRGNDIAGDWLDTVTEYSTQFRKLGLDGPEAIGLIQQGLQGAARDSDVVADSLKEFSIRAVDGSKDTAEGFKALGFNADDMARRFAEGGTKAHDAFGEVITALKNTDDPMQQKLIWQKLFGTQWEDLGDAVNKFDLKSAEALGHMQGASDEAKKKVNEHTNEWANLGKQVDVTFNKLKAWLTDSALGRFFGQTLPHTLGGLLDFINDDPNSTGQSSWKPPAGYDPKAALPQLFPGAASPPPGAPPLPSAPPGPQSPLDALFPTALPPGVKPVPQDLPQQGQRTPIVPDADQQKAQTDADKRKAIEAQFPLDQFLTDPYSQIGGINNQPGWPGQSPLSVNVQNLPSTSGLPGLLPGSAPGGTGGFPWDAVAQAESSGNWANRDTGNNGHFGGLQFSPETWLAYGGGQFAQNPADATREQQIEIANRTAFTGYNGVKPQGLGAWETIVKGMVPGVTVNTPAGGLGGMPFPAAGVPSANFGSIPDSQLPFGGYSMPNGSNSGGYGGNGVQFPDWVYQLGAAFHLSPSTYPGHQEDRGEGNQGIDWNGTVADRQAFATFLAQYAAQLPGLEDVIFRNPDTGQDIGVNNGRLVGTPGSADPGYFRRGHDDFADHGDHLHTTIRDNLLAEIQRALGGGGVPSTGLGQNMYATNGPLQTDPVTGQRGYFQVDQQAVWEANNSVQKANFEFAQAVRAWKIAQEEQKQGLKDQSDVIEAWQKVVDAQNDVTKAEADRDEKQRGSFKTASSTTQSLSYKDFPLGDPRRVLAGVLGGIGMSGEEIGNAIGATGQPLGQLAENTVSAVAGFPLGNPGTPTAPNTGINQLAQERNPLFFAQASGFAVPDYSRQGGGPSAQDLMVNTGPPIDALGRVYSDTAALVDRTFSSFDAAENARHDQVMSVLNQVAQKLGVDVLAPVIGQGVSSGINGLGEGVTQSIGDALGDSAGPPIAAAVEQALPAGGGGQSGGGGIAAATATAVENAIQNPPPAAPGMASGGGITGGIPNKDSVPILGMPGEWMLTTDEVSKMGGFVGVRQFLNGLHRNGGLRRMATGGGVDVSSTVGAEWFGVSQVPILGAIVNLLVAVLLKVIGVQVQARDTLNEISADFRSFRGDFKAFDAAGRVMNDTSGLVDRTSTNEQTATDERIRILKQVLEGLLQFIIEKIIVPIGKAVANTAINIGSQLVSGAIQGGLTAALPTGGSVIGGALGNIAGSAISAAGSAAVEIISQIGTTLAESLISVGLDAIGELFQSYLPDLAKTFFSGGLAAAIFDPIGNAIQGLIGGASMVISGLFGGLASLVPGIPFDSGGLAIGKGLMFKDVAEPELVLSPRETSMFDRMVAALERHGDTTRGEHSKSVYVTQYVSGNNAERIADEIGRNLAGALG